MPELAKYRNKFAEGKHYVDADEVRSCGMKMSMKPEKR